MADKFRALLATKDGDRQNVSVTELTEGDLMDGEVTVAVEHSTVNYKDGLAITGKVPIIRKFPLIPGVDLAGGGVAFGGSSFPGGRSRRGEWLWTWRGPSWRLRRAGAR
jgi:NADPH:quinone reductase-like Zn-dependent oxidoreductase